MIRPGLVSITFRSLSSKEVIDLVIQGKLEAIEWGGDIHVPHGDIKTAREVGKMTVGSGLTVSAYGSYYRVGHPESALGKSTPANDSDRSVSFDEVLETAVELGAPKIRVWAGTQGTDTADERYFEQVVKDSERIADLAASAGVRIAYEYHGNTLTDTDDAAQRLLDTVNCKIDTLNMLLSYWQPRRLGNLQGDLAGIAAVTPWLSDIHVFSWHPESGDRLALADRTHDWLACLQQLQRVQGDRFALLEFVQDDEPANFLQDAKTVKAWLNTLTSL